MNVIHPAVWVSDLEATKAFYLDVLGLEHSRESEGEDVHDLFVKGEDGTEIQLKHSPGRSIDPDRETLDHIAIEVDDIEAAVDACREAGSEVLTEPYTNDAGTASGAYVTDPDGYAIEFIQYH